MINYVFIATGQCGNQLSFELLNSIYQHQNLIEKSSGDSIVGAQEIEDTLYYLNQSIFRKKKNQSIARIVSLDTEPKVIEDCLQRSRLETEWSYDPSRVAYRHGGAGNNWALGYQMASGDFLELAMDCIRKEIELCDSPVHFVVCQSLAGGTGSGLGTHLSELLPEIFPNTFQSNIIISPYHFSEIIVQHYNIMLCLSKLYEVSDSLILFENEIAYSLCQQMKNIQKPLLKDLNETISNYLVSLFLPKIHERTPIRSVYHNLTTDINKICQNPHYKLLNIKVTPQTSSQSIEYTYDSWSTLIKTIQRLQISGVISERLINRKAKGLGSSDPQQGIIKASNNKTPQIQENNFIKSVGTSLCCHGETSLATAKQLQHFESQAQPIVKYSPNSKGVKNESSLQFFEEFVDSHSSHHNPFSNPKDSIEVNYSHFMLNKYRRATSSLCNDQSILPLLQRSFQKSSRLFEVNAYTHQYTDYGLEHQDFLRAFHSVGSIIQGYTQL